MLRIKILYDPSYIDDPKVFQEKIIDLKKNYGNNFITEKSKEKKFDFYINNKIVYTVDDNFSLDYVSTDILINKIDQHIYNIKVSKREKKSGRFDDVNLIDY